MKAKFYYNQYANGGAVEREGWEVINASELQPSAYGSKYCMKEREIELPEGFTIGEDCYGEKKLYHNGYQADVKGDYEHIELIGCNVYRKFKV